MIEEPSRARKPGRDREVAEVVGAEVEIGAGAGVGVGGVDVEAEADGEADVAVLVLAIGVAGIDGVGDDEVLAVAGAPGSDGSETDAEADDVDTPPMRRDGAGGMSVTKADSGAATAAETVVVVAVSLPLCLSLCVVGGRCLRSWLVWLVVVVS